PRRGARGSGQEEVGAGPEPRPEAPRAAPDEARPDGRAPDHRRRSGDADRRARRAAPQLRGPGDRAGAAQGPRHAEEEDAGRDHRPRRQPVGNREGTHAMTMQSAISNPKKSLPVIAPGKSAADLDVAIE